MATHRLICLTLVLALGWTGCSDDSADAEPDATAESDGTADVAEDDAAESDVADEPAGPPTVEIATSLGSFVVELEPEDSPVTVENFLNYVDAGYYDGQDGAGATIFHRVIPDFMVQGGGFTDDMSQKDTLSPIELESQNGLFHLRGTIAMARTNVPDSATSQFFVNHVDNAFLNYESDASPGYAVFGRVTAGLDVIDAIAAVQTGVVGGLSDVPLEPVTITSVSRLE